ncbi:hypothetical protein DFH06DRAFT_1478399 [Mycena polygramma]|nr:hypothetical protein DFH06DRAFT_1478399 [Mycena polygramma]
MKIQPLVFKHEDFKLLMAVDGLFYWLPTEYERIEERGWGCLNPDSPIPGLCTDLVATCFVFVFHCAASRRTTLCHAVSGTDTSGFDAQMMYVVGDDPRSEVDLVVFKGISYGDPNSGAPLAPPEIMQDDLRWVSQILDHIRSKTPSCNASVHPKALPYGVVLVEKLSGDVTVPTPPTPLFRPVQCGPSPPTWQSKRSVVDTFYRIQSTAAFVASNSRSYPCFQVYDGMRRLMLPPSSDATKEILRIATMHPSFPSFQAIQRSDWDICRRVVPDRETAGYLETLSSAIKTGGAPCEVEGCRTLTTQKCSTCKGVYYCSKTHQTEDWMNHRVWCKSHRYIPGGFETVWEEA